MVNPGGQCPFCLSIDVVQAGYPEGPTRLTWYQCHACRKMWFHRIGDPDYSCSKCNGLEEPTSTADSIVIPLRCASCGSEWFFRTTTVFEKTADPMMAIADRTNHE
jgi:transposase-like protein